MAKTTIEERARMAQEKAETLRRRAEKANLLANDPDYRIFKEERDNLARKASALRLLFKPEQSQSFDARIENFRARIAKLEAEKAMAASKLQTMEEEIQNLDSRLVNWGA